MTEQLREIIRPFPPSLVKEKPGSFKASYVEHSDITQRLLEVVGPFDFRITELIRNQAGEVEGCLAELTVEIDGRRVTVVEVGDVEQAGGKNNGARTKDAASDAIKRCAMRLGLGLHLWCGDHYYLEKKLGREPEPGKPGSRPSTSDGEVAA